MKTSVVLSGRRRPLEETAALAGTARARTLVVPANVGDPAVVRRCSRGRSETFGRLDVLFNNAGISAPGQSCSKI